jgi:hypothetical protein
MECVVEIMNDVLHMDFTRNADKMERIGRLVDGRSRPLKVMLKRLEGKKEVLATAKLLKEVEKYKIMFISPDSTRNQQEKDRKLRRQLKFICDTAVTVTGARTKNGKVIKKRDRRHRNCQFSSRHNGNSKDVSADSNLVKNALFDVSAKLFFCKCTWFTVQNRCFVGICSKKKFTRYRHKLS